MYEQNGLLEIIEADPSSLSPVEALYGGKLEENSLPLFDDQEIINQILNTLIKAKPKNYDILPYLERVKIESVKS